MMAICKVCNKSKWFKDHTEEDVCENCYDKAMNEMSCWQVQEHVKNCSTCRQNICKKENQ